LICGGLVDENRSVKWFGVRFRSSGGKETGAPETVHQRKHINNDDDITRTDDGQTIWVHSPRALNYQYKYYIIKISSL